MDRIFEYMANNTLSWPVSRSVAPEGWDFPMPYVHSSGGISMGFSRARPSPQTFSGPTFDDKEEFGPALKKTRIGPEVPPKCYAGSYLENIEAIHAVGATETMYMSMLANLCSMYGVVEALENLYLVERTRLHEYSRKGAWKSRLDYLMRTGKQVFLGMTVSNYDAVRKSPEMHEVSPSCAEGDCGNLTMSLFLTDLIKIYKMRLGLLGNYNEVSAGNFVEALLHVWKGYPGYEPLCLVLLVKDHLLSGTPLLVPDRENPLLEAQRRRQEDMPGRTMSVSMVKAVLDAGKVLSRVRFGAGVPIAHLSPFERYCYEEVCRQREWDWEVRGNPQQFHVLHPGTNQYDPNDARVRAPKEWPASHEKPLGAFKSSASRTECNQSSSADRSSAGAVEPS